MKLRPETSDVRQSHKVEQLDLELVYSAAPPSPLDWLLSPKGDTLAEKVLARLIQAEAHEPDPSFRDDYRQTFIALSLAIKGSPIPFIEASYLMYGVHPDKLHDKVLARREALLGPKGLAEQSASGEAVAPEQSYAPLAGAEDGHFSRDSAPVKKSVQSVKASMKEARRG